MLGFLRRLIETYVLATPGVGEGVAAVQLGAEQAESDERSEQLSEQGRVAADREQLSGREL